MELIKAISMLCSLNIGSMDVNLDRLENRQIACHKYYITCLAKKLVSIDAVSDDKIFRPVLAVCISERL